MSDNAGAERVDGAQTTVGTGETILVVEDDPDDRDLLARAFRKASSIKRSTIGGMDPILAIER